MFNMKSVSAEFEANLIRMRTREGMGIVKKESKLRSKPPRLSPKQDARLAKSLDSGDYTKSELAGVFGV